MAEEFAIHPHSPTIHYKNQPLYFANFQHHPVYRVYRHRQKSTPKPNHLTNRDSAKERVPAASGTEDRRDREKAENNQPTDQPTKKKTQHKLNLCNITHQNPQITQISPISRVIIPNKAKQLTNGALPTFAYTSVAPTSIVYTTIA